jgi:23S rRNA (uracil1939-C5)-methyltransferase
MGQDLAIERLGAQGDGIAESGVYVPFTLPGERVRAKVHGDRGTLVEVLEPAPERTEPGCPHFGICGGCALQHASDALVARWKADLVRAALAARGIEDAPVAETRTSPPGTRRRITVAARRTKKGVAIGFHAPRSDEIVPVSACLVADPALIDALPALEELVHLGASRRGEIRITLTLSAAGIDCAVTEAKPLSQAELAGLAGAANRAGLARLAWNGEIAITRAPPVQAMGPAQVLPPPGGFLQPTPEGEAALVAAVRDAVGGAGRIADLFSGCGTFALPLAEGAEVQAVDAERAALDALDTAWRGAPGLRRITAEARDLFARPLRAAELAPFDAAVIDPPRAGARAQAEQIAAARDLPVVAMVSCNPATFARDARLLIDGGHRLDWVRPVDQFRWSPHVELAARFSRPGSG